MRSLQKFLWIGIAAALPVAAQTYQITSPTAQYTGNTTLLPVVSGNFSTVSTLSAGGQTISFSPSLIAGTVGSNWNFWGAPPQTESSTPRVVFTDPGATAVTITLAVASLTFGFEIEPANQCAPLPACAVPPGPATPFNMSATFYSASSIVISTVTRAITNNGALLEAVSSSTPIASVVVTAPASSGGFAMAQFRFGSVLLAPASTSSVPALRPSATGALALMLAATGSLLARRRAEA